MEGHFKLNKHPIDTIKTKTMFFKYGFNFHAHHLDIYAKAHYNKLYDIKITDGH